MKHKIEIPEGCKAIVRKEGRFMIVDIEPKFQPFSFKAGDVVTLTPHSNGTKLIGIISEDCNNYNVMLRCYVDNTMFKFYFSNETRIYTDLSNYKTELSTQKEQELLFNNIEANGYEYNAESNTIEKKRWKPKKGEVYYTPVNESNVTWYNYEFEELRYSLGLIFKTKAESDEASEKIRQMFAK